MFWLGDFEEVFLNGVSTGHHALLAVKLLEHVNTAQYERWLHRCFYRKKITPTCSSMQWQQQELGLYVATLHFSSGCCILPSLTVSGRWWVWPDGTSPSKHLVSIITAMMMLMMALAMMMVTTMIMIIVKIVMMLLPMLLGTVDTVSYSVILRWRLWSLHAFWATASKWSKEIAHLSLLAFIVWAEKPFLSLFICHPLSSCHPYMLFHFSTPL